MGDRYLVGENETVFADTEEIQEHVTANVCKLQADTTIGKLKT